MPLLRPAVLPECPVRAAIIIAVGELVHLNRTVPRIVGLADAEDFESRRDLLVSFAKIVDRVIHTICSEAAEHTNELVRSDFESILRDALHDRAALGSLDAAAEQWREDNAQFGVGA